MDPNFFRNSLSSRYAAQDITSLLSEQAGLSQGLSLGSAFPGTNPLTSRTLGPMPGYAGHALHTPSLGDTHFSNLSGQSHYKPLPVGQPTYSDPYASLRLQQSEPNISKSIFQQEPTSLKDVSSYATTVPANNSIDVSQKTWGLSNFVTPNHNLYSHTASDLSGLDYSASISLPSQPVLNPPPAHSSKPAPLVQRNMYGGADMFLSRTTKSPPSHTIFDHRSHAATPVSSQPSLFSYSQTNAYPVKSEINLYSNTDTITYEAVSPATPETHNHGGDSYSSLQDLASISSTQQKLDVNIHQKQMVQQERTIKTPLSHNQKPVARNVRQDIYNGQTQLGQIKQSPQPSPISVGGSPQMQIGSPPAPIPSSTVVQAPPPVQAPADSTTKPKKARSRKRKEQPVINEFKSEPGTHGYSPQTFTGSPDIPQRGNGSDFMNNHQQQNFMQTNRNHQQMLSSASLVEQNQCNSPLMTSMQQPFTKQENQSTYIKSENIPMYGKSENSMYGKSENSMYVKNENQSIYVKNENQQPNQQQHQPNSQSQMVLQSQPSTSQSSMYTISGALEMSREAVFPNHELLQGYSSNEISNYGMQDSFSNQLVERPIDGMGRQDMYNGQEESVYNVSNAYGGQFVSPNSVLNMDIGNSNSQQGQSTIDEAALSSLMDESYREATQQESRKAAVMNDTKVPYLPLIATVDVEQDEELSHFAGPITQKQDTSKDVTSPLLRDFHSPPAPQPNPRHEIKNASGGGSFMDSFMSFLQGKKPETLSSMSSAIIHTKPQLPKYIPEPRRPRPVVTEDSTKKSGDSLSSSQANSDFGFSDDDEEFTSETKNVVQKAISNLGNENESVKFSTNKAGGLTMKINLSKVKKAEEDAKSKLKSKKSPKPRKTPKEKVRPTFGLKEQPVGKATAEEDLDQMLPLRQLSARKAKEQKSKYVDSDTDSDTLKPIRKPGDDSDEAYDSDRDPVWTPVSLDKKPAFEPEIKKKRQRQPKGKPGKSRKLSGNKKGARVDVVELDSDSDDDDDDDDFSTGLKVGDFVIDCKDLRNYESFPVWKIESGRMLHKYELFTDNSRILHKSIPTFSSWLPSMQNSLRRIRVKTVFRQGEKEHVEVIEEDRPKPTIDSKLEEKYEEHPLVEAFNVYIQTFLSQALEPGFLSAIRDSNERFYLDALDQIDEALTKHINKIDDKVLWKPKFKEAVMTRPHLRELDRPNLKQSCQACESASQPAIKSVHLFGNPYNKFSVQELKGETNQNSQEFMIGKTASGYVGPYHTMYHFKYNLYKRCQAKVKIVQESDRSLDNAAILDQCLQNRAWVLQIFQDLKQLLEKG